MFNSPYSLGFVYALNELVWIRGRMLASKNMNARSQFIIIFWDKIDFKNKSDVIWLFNCCKQKTTIFLNIVHGTIQLLTESNESESVIFLFEGFYGLRI